ncbi:hypothetical protein COU76_03385 [Candidatus Peregrinibacteria bacterium CG10_big_fil_rev_8_21_14_0_10_49_10]|nr:MAG: hypothetical protein COU76_03385 [Candidatus Peregrinibacteria bacterium CG10_big_fil_rev_8_21_14_0_10_49_10]
MKKQSVLGIDMGGTKVDLVRYNSHTLQEEEREHFLTHAERGWQQVFADLVSALRQLRSADTVAVGVGVPGLVQKPEGMIVTLPNIPGSQHIPLQKELSAEIGMHVIVENDANVFALAEAHNSNFAHKGVVVGMTLGTGVGGGIVIDGDLFRGTHGFAGEIGHMLLSPGKLPYVSQDTRGDVEQFLSGTALGKRCTAARSPGEYLEGEVCAPMKQDVLREVAWVCVSLTALLDPSLIVLGGSVGKAFKPHLQAIIKEMEEWSLPHAPLPQLTIATLDDAATRGAALVALKECSSM